MLIELTKQSDERHTLRCARADGSVQEADLESSTFLVHDFTHLSYELEAGLQESFWGLVASGTNFADLRGLMDPKAMDVRGTEIVRTEMIVGPLQGLMLGRREAQEVLEGLKNLFEAHGEALPEHLSESYLQNCKERYRRLMGEWKALPYGQTMTVEWSERTS